MMFLPRCSNAGWVPNCSAHTRARCGSFSPQRSGAPVSPYPPGRTQGKAQAHSARGSASDKSVASARSLASRAARKACTESCSAKGTPPCHAPLTLPGPGPSDRSSGVVETRETLSGQSRSVSPPSVPISLGKLWHGVLLFGVFVNSGKSTEILYRKRHPFLRPSRAVIVTAASTARVRIPAVCSNKFVPALQVPLTAISRRRAPPPICRAVLCVIARLGVGLRASALPSLLRLITLIKRPLCRNHHPRFSSECSYLESPRRAC